MGLFKPSWKSSDPHKRFEAVQKLKNQDKLKKVAARDPEGYVRYTALERITDESFLAAYAVQINDDGLRNKALEQIHSVPLLAQLAAMLTRNSEACRTCLKNIPGQIPREALNLMYKAGGWAALLAAERMNDASVLEKLKIDSDSIVRHRAERDLQEIKKQQQMKSSDPDLQRRLLQESNDPDIVVNAAEKLRDDKLILRRLLTEASADSKKNNWQLTRALTEKLSDPQSFRFIFEQDNPALHRLTDEPALMRLAKTDPDFVREIALSEKYTTSIRNKAVMQLTDPALLTEIGLNNPDLRFHVMLNKHFDWDQRFVAALLKDPQARKIDFEQAASHISDPELILERLSTEKNAEIIHILCTCHPNLKPYADQIKTVLESGPVAGVNYERRQPTPTVTNNLRRDADRKIAGWISAAEKLIAFAKTGPKSLLPLWDRLDAAITGSETEIRYHRYLDTGKSEWDDSAQDFKFSFDEKFWSEKKPTGLVFPPRPQE